MDERGTNMTDAGEAAMWQVSQILRIFLMMAGQKLAGRKFSATNTGVGRFQVDNSLVFKERLSAESFTWKWIFTDR